MISKYLKERSKWKKFGKPLRKQEEMDELFSICLKCINFKKESDTVGLCGVCGCGIKKEGTWLNKIAWGTTRCPLPDPKWKESHERYKKDVSYKQEDLEEAQKEHRAEAEQNKKPPEQQDCGCGKK